MDEPFAFRDPKHRTIYASLAELIGDGPAAHFKDVCRLLAAEPPYESANNLVGNLLREIESAVRAACLLVSASPEDPKEPAGALSEILLRHDLDLESALSRDVLSFADTLPSPRPRQKDEIRAILAELSVEARDAVATAWEGIAGKLHELTHRRNLDAPRPLGIELQSCFDRLVLILEILMPHLRDQYASFFSATDQLRRITSPTRTDVKVFTEQVPRHIHVQARFFEDLGPGWLLPLRSFFKASPRPRESMVTGWPAFRYLARMAERPELQGDIQSILSDVEEPENPFLLRDLVEAAVRLPVGLARSFTERVLGWVERLSQWPPLLLDSLIGLAEHFGNAGEPFVAKRVLAGALPLTSNGRSRVIAEYEYDILIVRHLDALVVAAGRQTAVDLLLNALDASLPEVMTGPSIGSEDSASWRPAIEEHGQNRLDDPRNQLGVGCSPTA